MALDPGEAKRYTGKTPLREKISIGEVTYGFVPQTSFVSTAKVWETQLKHFREALRASLATTNLLAPDKGGTYILNASVGERKENRPFVGENTAFFPVQYRLVRISDGKEILNAAITGQHAYYEGMSGSSNGQHDYAVRHNIWQLVERLYHLEKAD